MSRSGSNVAHLSPASAYVGAPVKFAPALAFDWLFSDPFSEESDFTPPGHVVPKVEDERPIFVDELSDRSLTKSRLRDDALKFGAGLQELHGLDPDNTIALPPTSTCERPHVAPVVLVQLPNCLPFATIVLGALAAGLTATLASPALTSKEVAWILQNSRPSAVFTASSCLASMREAVAAQEDRRYFGSVPVYVVDVANDAYPTVSQTTAYEQSWSRVFASTSDGLKRPSSSSQVDARSRAAVILWSSGTSGRSKGVLLSHHALNFSVASLWHDADFYRGGRQRWLGFVPFFHVYGLLNIFLLAVPAGAAVYGMPAFRPEAMLAAVRRRNITYLHMAPPVAVFLAKSPSVEPFARRDGRGANAFSSVVGAVTGGAPLGYDVVAQVFARLGVRVRLGYGLTETCNVSLQPGLTEEQMKAQGNDTGLPHWGVELAVASPRQASTPEMEPAEVGEEGEILVRSPGLMMSYLPATGLMAAASAPARDISATTEVLTPDGWFRTGDVGKITASGSLVITDRIKEMIKVRGFQVPPAELEAVLCGSAEVADAGVVAVHDAGEATEWPRAFVVPAAATVAEDAGSRRGLELLAGRLRDLVEAQTSKYKWLRGGIVFVEQVPKSPSGKILRRLMRDGGVRGVEVQVYKTGPRFSKL
ncbi:hypothetical protein N3K66_001731 [Trichothecium roseum]|uniref:Uncharacterized protein n=1 Tax=Trichothecium roseum TaxID=47278 RepID=A0ACC0V7L4_9HYPO|nr:hypothetical protein N3K66_001731 [Trichothecium roseum]